MDATTNYVENDHRSHLTNQSLTVIDQGLHPTNDLCLTTR